MKARYFVNNIKEIIVIKRKKFTPFPSKHLIMRERQSVFALRFSFAG